VLFLDLLDEVWVGDNVELLARDGNGEDGLGVDEDILLRTAMRAYLRLTR
jgi:hypothetical protein